ncbi:MAG: M48 family metallopeptidase [Candidatus Omnitrophica bacterium]|nr:M48 family metallopeptidase [Candidatus Omnitrophota bacterium]
MDIKVIRSRKRMRTVSARVEQDTLIVHAPAILPQERLDKIVLDFKSRFERKKLKEDLKKKQDLAQVAAGLNAKYFGNQLKINSIEYVTTQNRKFGCCDYTQARIRISHRIGLMPAWVRDYVVVHEMAHLIEPNHSRAFWNIVFRYRLAERAKGYLMAAFRNSDL